MADSIHNITFLTMRGVPQRAQQEWEAVARPGVNGTALWATGSRGEPYAVRTEEPILTYAAARLRNVEYVKLVNLGAVSISYGTTEFQQFAKVLAVRVIEVKRCVRVKIAGNPINYGAIVTAEWQLLPIDPTIQPPE